MYNDVVSSEPTPASGDQEKVLLIGGGGFVGHHLALDLAFQGAQVTVSDALIVNDYFEQLARQTDDADPPRYLNFIAQRLALLNRAGVENIRVDARSYQDLCALVDKVQPDIVIHLASVAHANRQDKDAYSTFDHSLQTLENALDACRLASAPVRRFVYMSSSMVYGDFAGAQADEDRPCEPIGIYGALKFAGEKIVKAYGDVFGLPYTIIRTSAPYGERCVSRRIGQVLIENAMDGVPLTIHGDGSDEFDFTYIRDLVDGLRLAIQSAHAENETFNIAYGSASSIDQLVEVLKEALPDVKVRHQEHDHLIPERGTLSIDKARALIGFNPSWPLERGYTEYVGWYLKHWGVMNEPPISLAKPPAFRPERSLRLVTA